MPFQHSYCGEAQHAEAADSSRSKSTEPPTTTLQGQSPLVGSSSSSSSDQYTVQDSTWENSSQDSAKSGVQENVSHGLQAVHHSHSHLPNITEDNDQSKPVGVLARSIKAVHAQVKCGLPVTVDLIKAMVSDYCCLNSAALLKHISYC